jgi:hypothetical protein
MALLDAGCKNGRALSCVALVSFIRRAQVLGSIRSASSKLVKELRDRALPLETPILQFYYSSVLPRTAILDGLLRETDNAVEQHDVEPEATASSFGARPFDNLSAAKSVRRRIENMKTVL